MSERLELVIRGGMLHDGSGGEPFRSDVGIAGGLIAAIGENLPPAAAEIDAAGRIVTPGFVDIHTHYDGQATWDSHLAPSSLQGVTTVVAGNCGVGFAPVRPQDHALLIELMEGVEDIPGVVLSEGLDWRWESFGDFLDRLEATRHDIDIGVMLPHGPLRVYVMAERAARLEEATAEDNAAMRDLATAAVRAGAMGFSTSRTLNHRSSKGAPTPSLRATEEELMAIALGVRDGGGGVLEMISDFNTPDLDTEFSMWERIVAASGQPLSLSLAQSHRSPDGWRRILARVERAAAAGLPIKVQVAPRPIGSLMGFDLSFHPFGTCPSYAPLASLPRAQRLAELRKPDVRTRLIREWTADDASGAAPKIDFRRVYPFGDRPDYEPPATLSLEALAERSGCAPIEVAYDLMMGRDGSAILFVPFANYADGHLDACGEMMRHPDALLGLGDGGAHVGIVCDASFTTYLLAHWGRDRPHGRLPLPWLVRRQTWDNARAMGLHDRGRIAVGLRADLNVIDFETLSLRLPQVVHNLPAGGRRLIQRADGYDATIVAGTVVYRHGEPTGALPGRVLRGPVAATGGAA